MRHGPLPILMLLLLAACTIRETVQPTSVPATLAAAPIRPASTQLPLSSATPIPAMPPTQTVAPNTIQPPLATLLLNVSSTEYALTTCYDRVKTPGQVWLSTYPYASASPLLADKDTGYYAPVWSPNGQWITYFSVSPRDLKQTSQYQGSAILLEYATSDSIWVISPDASVKRQVSDLEPRKEYITFHNSGPFCDVVGGIRSIQGWSADSSWIAFEHVDESLYVTNIQAARTQAVADHAASAIWAPKTNRLAVSTYNGDWQAPISQLEIVNIGGASSPIVIDPPAEISSGYWLSALAWKSDESGLVVLSRDGRRYMQPQTVWLVGIDTGEWKKVGQFTSENVVGFAGQGDRILTCTSGAVQVRDAANWQVTGTISVPGENVCRFLGQLNDSAGTSLLSLTNNVEGRNIWIAPIETASPQALELLDRAQLGFPPSLEIVSASWHP